MTFKTRLVSPAKGPQVPMSVFASQGERWFGKVRGDNQGEKRSHPDCRAIARQDAPSTDQQGTSGVHTCHGDDALSGHTAYDRWRGHVRGLLDERKALMTWFRAVFVI